MKRAKAVVFVGPSLPAKEVRALLPGAALKEPAKQGDVFEVLRANPEVIVLLDGVFEHVASVWHHELRAALASGVTVFGASSMGALRAAELWSDGMIGVGEIAARYRSGEWIDDADVALLHAGPEHGHRALTVPLVNVRATLEAAVRAKVLSRAQSRRVEIVASRIFYQDRHWPLVVEKSGLRGSAFGDWLTHGAVDLKANDARECLRVAKAFIDSRAPRPPVRSINFSSYVRRVRLMEREGDAEVAPLLLSALARMAGFSPVVDARDVQSLESLGLAADERVRLVEHLSLADQLTAQAQHVVSDGPARSEGVLLAKARMILARSRRREAR